MGMDSGLKHYGIKGMKWGVRRYQNNDGSRTTAGEKRTNKTSNMSDEELQRSVRRKILETQYDKISGKSSKMDKTKKTVDASSNLVKQVKTASQKKKMVPDSKKLDLSNMTEQQLRDRINRTHLERQYDDLFGSGAKTVSNGRAFASNMLDAAGTALALGSSVLGVALAIKELRK